MPTSWPIDEVGVSTYKRRQRDHIATTHTILANVGDMWWDVLTLPLRREMRVVQDRDDDECAILFPPDSHGEAAVKLPAACGTK